MSFSQQGDREIGRITRRSMLGALIVPIATPKGVALQRRDQPSATAASEPLERLRELVFDADVEPVLTFQLPRE